MGHWGQKTLRTATLRTRHWGQATLRTGDFEDRRLWGQTFLYKTSRTDIEDKHFPQLNIYFIYFIYFIFYNIDSKYYIIHCGQTLRLWGQTLRTDIEDRHWGQTFPTIYYIFCCCNPFLIHFLSMMLESRESNHFLLLLMLNSGKWPQIFCHIQRHHSKKSKCRGPALQGYIGYIWYGTLRTGGVEDSDIKDKTLRTGDIERFFPFVRELKIHEKYGEIMK